MTNIRTFSMRWRLGAALIATLAAVAWLAPRADAAKGGDPRIHVLRKNAKTLGYTPAQWCARWWQWANSIPAASNPIIDQTGEFAAVGQNGPVWFIGGVLGNSGTAERTIKIPAGKALFMPVLNGMYFNYENDPAPFTREQMRQGVSDYVNAADSESLSAVLNGSEIPGLEKFRFFAEFLDTAFPEDNAWTAIGAPVPAGLNGPAATDGYWLMLRPLPPGTHELRLRGSIRSPYNFDLDVTYHITVIEPGYPE